MSDKSSPVKFSASGVGRSFGYSWAEEPSTFLVTESLPRRELDASSKATAIQLLDNAHALALAVDAPPSAESAAAAAAVVEQLRAEGTIDRRAVVGVAFRGPSRPSLATVDVLKPAMVYVVTDALAESAQANAQSFLDQAATQAVEARRIVRRARH